MDFGNNKHIPMLYTFKYTSTEMEVAAVSRPRVWKQRTT